MDFYSFTLFSLERLVSDFTLAHLLLVGRCRRATILTRHDNVHNSMCWLIKGLCWQTYLCRTLLSGIHLACDLSSNPRLSAREIFTEGCKPCSCLRSLRDGSPPAAVYQHLKELFAALPLLLRFKGSKDLSARNLNCFVCHVCFSILCVAVSKLCKRFAWRGLLCFIVVEYQGHFYIDEHGTTYEITVI